jgi:pimeloyl-ACP methyl ester carboxylesterase
VTKPSLLRLPAGDRIAYRHTPGNAPQVLSCGGYTTHMTGTKATTLERHCRDRGRAYTRFDYRGHGASSGSFADGTVGRWRDDALAIVDRVTSGPLIVVGSSLGGWLMLLVALARPARVQALVGVAAAPDFTEDLLLPQASPAERRQLDEQGYWLQPSAYGGPPYPVTRALLEDGRAHLLLRAPVGIRCPVHLLHGQRDPDVPWPTALKLAERLESDDVEVELIKAGDHRLSTPADLRRITAAIERLAGEPAPAPVSAPAVARPE